MIRELEYQAEAARDLCTTTNRLLSLEDQKTIVFKAPTGSGKTVIMAQYLAELVEGRVDSRRLAFIWTAPRQLHLQSKEKLEAFYADSKALRCLQFEELVDRKIGEREILFLNWESINKVDNIYIRENEQDFNLSTILQNTREAGEALVLVIDESHFAAMTETSRELVDMFQPLITIEVSATPAMRGDEVVTVQREDVIAEGVIKKRILINPGFKNEILRHTVEGVSVRSTGSEGTDAFVMRMAVRKRDSLARQFQELGAGVNPLLLIQLPDHRQGEADRREDIERLLEKNHRITVANGKLAIYLAEDKSNLENITRNNSPVEVMIFKQAVALGWDCPRASILALFRDWQSFTFSTQTVGRILRMPELKHYANDELNLGFVFTSLKDLSIIEDIAGNYLTINYALRQPQYASLRFRSVYARRARQLTRLAPGFITDFLKAADDVGLKSSISIDVTDLGSDLMTDGVVSDLDEHPLHVAEGEYVRRPETAPDVQQRFDVFARESLKPDFHPEVRSVGRVKYAIHHFFRMSYPMQFSVASTRAQLITLHERNQPYFMNALNRAKEIYRERVDSAARQLEFVDAWELPASRCHSNRYGEMPYGKSIYQPFFELADASTVEKAFAGFLEHTLSDVQWFCKNGESDATWFAIAYRDPDGRPRPFYVDWIVQFKDGRIGLFDTKSGITAETAGPRAEGLAEYIRVENTKGRNLFGGIVVLRDGSWRLNDSPRYEYGTDLKGWKFLQ